MKDDEAESLVDNQNLSVNGETSATSPSKSGNCQSICNLSLSSYQHSSPGGLLHLVLQAFQKRSKTSSAGCTELIGGAENPEVYTIDQLCKTRMSVIRITNIPWDISTADIVGLFEGASGGLEDPDHVHVPINRESGKTLNEVFVEMRDPGAMQVALINIDKTICKSRALCLEPSSLQELHDAHFKEDLTNTGEYISDDSVRKILAICQNYKMYFSRKCAERPFEHVISILRLIPWQNLTDTIQQRLYDLVLGTLDALNRHLGKTILLDPSPQISKNSSSVGGAISINKNVLPRLIKAAYNFPAFSKAQKMEIASKVRETDHISSRFHSNMAPFRSHEAFKDSNYILEKEPVSPNFSSSSASVPRHERKSSLERLLDEADGKNSDADKLTDRQRRNVFMHLMFG